MKDISKNDTSSTVPARYRQPRRDTNGRILVGNDFELVDFVTDSHTRIWYNNLNVGYAQHHHDAMEIILCIDAPYTIVANGISYTLNDGDIFFIPPHIIHEIKKPTHGNRFVFLIDVDFLDALHASKVLEPLFMDVIFCSTSRTPQIYMDIHKHLMNAIDLYFEDGIMAEFDIYANLLQIFSILGRNTYQQVVTGASADETTKSREHFNKTSALLNYLNDHYMENITLETAANLTGFSKYHFERLFKEQTNTTFYDFLSRKRIREAQRLLGTDITITDVAFQTGFNNMTTFCRCFKKITGLTPSEYRNQFRNEQEHSRIVYEHGISVSSLTDTSL